LTSYQRTPGIRKLHKPKKTHFETPLGISIRGSNILSHIAVFFSSFWDKLIGLLYILLIVSISIDISFLYSNPVEYIKEIGNRIKILIFLEDHIIEGRYHN
jgi:hypothetical protein